MSLNLPPNNLEPITIFNPANFIDLSGGLTIEYANANYLKFPTAQGAENLLDINVSGTADFNSTVNVNGNLFVNNPSIFSDTVDITSTVPPTSSQIIPATNDSSTKIPTTAWVQSVISATPPSTSNLSAVLTVGNSAGTNNINMNNQNISGLNTLSFASTSQTSAYTGGTAGTYTNVGMTLDSNGKISSISSGTLSPLTVKRAYAYGNNITASLIQFNINIPLSGSSFTPRNQFVSFRLTFNQESYISGGVNQSFMTTDCILNLYPGRFTAGWLTQNAGAVLDEYSRGMISDNTIYATSSTANYVVNDATYCPFGRQFWSTNLSYTAGGSPAIGTRLNISGGAGTNQVYIYVLNPAGYPNAAIPQNFNISLELLNTSGSSGITTTGFSTYGGVDIS